MEYLTNLDKSDPRISITSQNGSSFTHPVKYYDFHVYYYAHNDRSYQFSTQLRTKLMAEFEPDCTNGSLIVKKLPDENIIGPHPTQFWEVDVCRPEIFVKVLSWFQLHHGPLSVLIHPQTGDDLLDHTERALWLGEKLTLLTDVFEGGEPGIPEFGVRGGRRISPEDW